MWTPWNQWRCSTSGSLRPSLPRTASMALESPHGPMASDSGLPMVLPLSKSIQAELEESIPSSLHTCASVQLGFAAVEGLVSFTADAVNRKALLSVLISARRAVRYLGLSRRPDTSRIYVRQLRLLREARQKQYVLCGGFCTTIELHFTADSAFGRSPEQFTGACALFCMKGGTELPSLQPEAVGEIRSDAGSVLLCSAEDLPRLRKVGAGGVSGRGFYVLLASDAGVVAGQPNNHTAKPQAVRRLHQELATEEALERRSRKMSVLHTWKRAQRATAGLGSSVAASSAEDAAKPAKPKAGGTPRPEQAEKRLRLKSKRPLLNSERRCAAAPPSLSVGALEQSFATPTPRVGVETVPPRRGDGNAGPRGDVVPSGDVVSSGDVVPQGGEGPRGDVVPDVCRVTSVLQGATIHRYWVDARQTGELPHSCVVSLRSFSPEYKQILWHYTPLVDPRLPNVVLRDADLVLPREVYSEMVSMKARPEHISDLFKARVLHGCGGWVADLDFLYLGRPLPTSSPGGLCLHAEPERAASCPYARQDELVRRCHDAETGWSTLNCGMMGGVQGDPFWDRVAKRILDDWRAHHRRMQGTRGAGADIGPVPMLLGAKSMQAVVSEALKKREAPRRLDAGRFDPISCCPLPRFLRSWHRDAPRSLQGYLVPAAAQVAEQSSCIQLREKKWPRGLLEEVVRFATRLRACRKMRLPVQLAIVWALTAKEVEARLAAVTPTLCHIYANTALAHTVVAFALSELAGKTPAQLEFLAIREPAVVALALLLYSHRLHRSRCDASFGEGWGFEDAERRMAELLAPKTPQVRVQATIARYVMLAGNSSLLGERGGGS